MTRVKQVVQVSRLAGLVLSLSLGSAAYAGLSCQPAILINHDGQALQAEIQAKYAPVFVDFRIQKLDTPAANPTLVHIANNATAQSQLDFSQQDQGIVKVVAPDGSQAFFSFNAPDGGCVVSGYEGEGIAYSWQGETVTFCTPTYYKIHSSCN